MMLRNNFLKYRPEEKQPFTIAEEERYGKAFKISLEEDAFFITRRMSLLCSVK
jgi:hypothetical protein